MGLEFHFDPIRYDSNTTLICFPFDLSGPADSVRKTINSRPRTGEVSRTHPESVTPGEAQATTTYTVWRLVPRQPVWQMTFGLALRTSTGGCLTGQNTSVHGCLGTKLHG